MTTASGNGGGHDAAVGFLVLFVTLWFLWPLQDVLTTLAVSGTVPFSRRMLVADSIGPALLIGATVYLRAPSMLWQIPMQALAAACLFAGVGILVLSWHELSPRSAAICVGYLAVGASLAWFMRNLQRHFLSPHKRRRPLNHRPERS